MIYQLVVALSIAATVSASQGLYKEDPTRLKQLWEAFKNDFQRNYSTMDEETHRFQNFVQNLKLADQRNTEELSAHGSAVHGITRFSDLTQAEFESRYLTADPSMNKGAAVLDTTVGTVDTTAALVDWTGKYTTAVKDQGYCGSCWAFSATEQIESDIMRTGGQTILLSVEQIVQCDKTSYGCDGGWTENAYDYVKKAGGIETEASYPYSSYQGTTGTCKANASLNKVTLSGYTKVSGETNMASYVQKTGPLSICIDASSWNSYNGGIMKSCGKKVNHCVQAVGVDASTSGYWKVRNSWGVKWGEQGFIRLAYGQDTCHLTNDPTWVAAKVK